MGETVATSQVRITNPQGLHARPADLFVKMANRFESVIEVTKDGEKVDGKSILAILTLVATAAVSLASAVLHVMAWVLGGSGPYVQSLRVVCYPGGVFILFPSSVFQFIIGTDLEGLLPPLCLLAWYVVLMVFGTRLAHGFGWGKAFAAAALPAVILSSVLLAPFVSNL